MKNLNTYISEAIKITSKSKVVKYNFCPKDKKELEEIVKQLIKERGLEADLNDIDTSQMTSMTWLFYNSKFNGNISGWDVSNVEYMNQMFKSSEFTGEHGGISNWDVRKVKSMFRMFQGSKFVGKIDNWKPNKNVIMADMFESCYLEKNPPSWYDKNKWS